MHYVHEIMIYAKRLPKNFNLVLNNSEILLVPIYSKDFFWGFTQIWVNFVLIAVAL